MTATLYRHSAWQIDITLAILPIARGLRKELSF